MSFKISNTQILKNMKKLNKNSLKYFIFNKTC